VLVDRGQPARTQRRGAGYRATRALRRSCSASTAPQSRESTVAAGRGGGAGRGRRGAGRGVAFRRHTTNSSDFNATAIRSASRRSWSV
jgi:hypothetical protein